MSEDRPEKQIVLIGIITAMICLCALLPAFRGMAWPFGKRPPDQPATPLTAEQLAQHPLLLYPQATVVSTSREAKRYGPDEPRPKHSRYLERQTEYQVGATFEEIADFYRTTLTRQGWILCRMANVPGGQSFWYQRTSSACVTLPDEEIFIFIEVPGRATPHRVVVRETLPSPLEWPVQLAATPTVP